jgi:phage-related protein
MGTNMEMVQNAYTGFSRGNFTMLDNLSLGFAGTKEGMQELLDSAQAISGVEYNIDSYADIVEAIHVVQDEMGITGTTAKEASETISGSVASMKSAWSNLVAGLANDNADIGTLIDNVVTSAETAFNNILPVAEKALMGIGQLVTDLAPIIGEKLPELITTLLPQIIETGAQFIGALGQGIIDNIPAIVDSGVQIVVQLTNGLVQALPQLAEGAVALVQSLGQSFAENAPQLLDAGMQLVQMIADGVVSGIPILIEQGLPMLMDFSGSLRENASNLIDAGIDLIMKIADGLIEGLPTMIETIPTIISNIAGIINDNAPKLIVAGVTLIGKLVVGIVKAIPALIAEFPKIIKAIVDVFTAFNWLQLGANIIKFIGDGIKSLASNIPNAIKDIGTKAVDFFKKIDWKNAGTSIINFIKNGITSLATNIPNALKGIGEDAVKAFKNIDWLKLGKDIINGIIKGIKSLAGSAAGAVTSVGSTIVSGAKKFFKIGSPSKLMSDEVGRYISEGIAVGIEDNTGSIMKSMGDIANMVSEPMDIVTGTSIPGARSTLQNVMGLPIIQPTASRNLTVILELDRMQLGKAVYKLNNEETQRVGVKLAGGFV